MNKFNMQWLQEQVKKFLSQKNLLPEAETFELYHNRFYFVWFCVVVFMLLLLGRAFYVQIIDQQFYSHKANSRIIGKEKTHAMRGMLLDRNGVPLAISSPVMTVFIDPTFYFEQKKIADEAREKYNRNQNDMKAKRVVQQFQNKSFDLNKLADILHMDITPFEQKLNQYVAENKRYVELKKEVSPQDVNEIRKLNLVGVSANTEYKRYYPQAQPNAQIIGMTNAEGVGIEGLELQLDQRLRGQDGEAVVMRDKERNKIKTQQVIQEEKAGENIHLSLDSRLQYVLYRELARVGQNHRANYASGIIVDVHTGEILAMNTWPSYNPNDPDSRGDNFGKRNRGAVDQFEPGSTIKPFSIAMGLRTGKYTPNSTINTSPGSMKLGGSTIRDTHNYGTLSLTNIIVKSSNVGVAKIALAEPLSALPMFYRELGFGQKTSANFLGEVSGKIQVEKNWTIPTVGTMAYGYGLDVSMLQLAQAYAMLGNKGIKLPLSLYKVEKTPEGKQILDPVIAEQVVLMMEKATHKGGTATQANIMGYRVAGKTGTSHKLREDGKGYEKNKYRSLFAGLAPVSNPRFAMIVVVDDPKQGGHYGGVVAAPVFSRVMQETLRLLNEPLDKPET
ncbi:penicillin-binding protein 2 [Moraxella sp. ZY21109]|uniref:peptidoglycan D,D-transpeptidase FtsI family protein n=1 Tax=Moraxella sp. ZY21109 TaxID=2911969 RepID=UPI003D7D831E